MAVNPITEKAIVTVPGANAHVLITQDATVDGSTKHVVRRVPSADFYNLASAKADINEVAALHVEVDRQDTAIDGLMGGLSEETETRAAEVERLDAADKRLEAEKAEANELAAIAVEVDEHDREIAAVQEDLAGVHETAEATAGDIAELQEQMAQKAEEIDMALAHVEIDTVSNRLDALRDKMNLKAESIELAAVQAEVDMLNDLRETVNAKAGLNELAAVQADVDKLGTDKVDLRDMTDKLTAVSNDALSLAVEVDQNSRSIEANRDALSATQGVIADIQVDVAGKVPKPSSSPLSDGQMLVGNQDGTTEWTDPVAPTDEQIGEAVSDWLDDHPEATTTVEDGSITMAKLSQEVQDAIGNNEGLSDQIIESDLKYLEAEVYGRQTVTEDTFRERLGSYCNLWLGGNGVGFIFFSDPHTASAEMDLTRSEFDLLMKTARIVYEGSPAEWVICGGDWLNLHHTLYEAAALCAPLQKKMQTMIGPGAYTIVGNHDLNAETPGTGGAFTHEQLNRMWYGTDTGYFVLHCEKADCYVLDSGSQSESPSSTYQSKQLKWFAENLLSNTKEHLFGAIHIVKVDSRFGEVADRVTKIADAFNNRTTVTVNGETYNFANASGTFHFLVAGHIHGDQITSQNNIPVMIIRRVFGGDECSMDMCYADFDNAVLHAVRIGAGESRDMNIISTIE